MVADWKQSYNYNCVQKIMLRPPYLDNGILYIRKRTLLDKQRNNKVVITWKRHVKERTKNKTKVNPKKT